MALVLKIVGAILLLLGIVTIVAAVRASRRPRRVLDSERAAVVVDDRVVASALARRAADAADVDPDHVVVTVGRTTATVRITPASGVPVDRDSVQVAVDGQLDRDRARPRLRGRIVITTNGKVGA